MKKSLLNSKSFAITFVIVNLFFMSAAFGQVTKTWVGTTGGSWTDVTKWSPGVTAPGALDSVVIPATQTAPITNIGGNGATITVRALTIIGNCNLQSGAASANFSTLNITNTLTVYPGITLTCGLDDAGRLDLTAGGTGIINGTIFMNSYSGGGYDRTVTINGNLVIASAGLITGQNTSRFVLGATGTLHIANTAGINTTGTGAILVPGTRTYTAGSEVIYEAAAAQVTGNATPTTCDITITNTSGVTLSAALTSTGTLAVTAGSTLNMANTNLSVAGLTGAGNLTHSSGTAGNRTLSVTGAINPAAFSGVISNGTANSVALTKTGAGTLTLTGANTYTGITTITDGTLSINSLNDWNVVPVASSLGAPASAVNGTIAMGATSVLQYTGAATSSNRIINTTADDVTIDASGTGTLTLTGGITATGNNNLTFTGTGTAIETGIVGGGTGTFDKDGTGTWTLSAANTFTGLTSINAGTLRWGVNSALSTGAVTVAGGILDLNGFTESVGTVTLTNGSIIGGTTLTSTGTFAMQNGTVSAILAGAGIPLNKTTAGTVTLSAANTYTGATTVSAGILLYGVNNAIASGNVIVNGGTLDIATFTDGVGTVQLTGGGSILGTTGILTSSATYDMQNGTVSAILAGTVGLTKSTGGTVTLSGLNTYTGVTLISGGILIANTLSNVAAASSLGAPALANATIGIGAATLRYTGAATSSDRIINSTANGSTIDASGTGTLTLTGGITGGNDIIMTGTGLGIESGAITTGGGNNFTKNGTGTWTLSNNGNNFTGTTTISAGVLSVATIAAGGTNSNLGAAGTITLTGGTLQYTGGNASTNRVVALTGTASVIEVTTLATNLTITGAATGGGGYHKAGPGTLTMGNIASTYTGPTVIDGGILSVGTVANGGNNSSLGASTSAAANLVIGDGTLRYTGATAGTNRNVTLMGHGNGPVGPYSTIEVTTAAAILTMSGVIANTPSVLFKGGPGSLVLSGTNLFTGEVVLNEGTLVAANTSALGPAGGPPNKLLTLNGGTLEFRTDASVEAYALHIGNPVTIILNRATSGPTNTTHNLDDISFNPGATLTVNRGGNITGAGIGTVRFLDLKLWADVNIVNAANTNVTFAGAVAGAVGTSTFTKSGPGTLTKTVADWVFPGDFTIAAGTYAAGTFNTSVAGNWINNGGTLTGSGASRIIFNGTSAQTIGGSAATTFNGIEVANAAGVSLTTLDVTANAAVTLTSGRLTIPINRTLLIANGTPFGGGPTFTLANSIVTQSDPGSTQKGFVTVNNIVNPGPPSPYLIPTSDGVNYLPVTLTPTEVTANNDYSVCVFTGVTANGERNGTPFTATQKNTCVDAVWFVNHNVASAASTTMTVEWPVSLEGTKFQGFSNIGIAHWDGPNWGIPVGTGTHGSATRTAVTAFSPFGVGNPDFLVLATKITYFNAAKGNGYNTVNWQAACSSSQATFEVLRSTDGRNFSSINSLTASQARCAQPFNYQDNTAPQGVVYYRLKVIDIDGKETLSGIVKISSEIKAMELAGIAPNPVSNVAQLKINASKVDVVNLTIISSEGQVVYRNNVQLQPGSSVVNLDIAKLPAGVYMIKGMFSDGETNTVKFLKQ